jgi:hypothetical protein
LPYPIRLGPGHFESIWRDKIERASRMVPGVAAF